MSLIYAHRGASSEFPENTLAAFKRALDSGVDGIELDVHLSHDGVPVVIHDETVDRTTNGAGRISTMSLEEIQALDAGAGQRVPTLGEVLDLVDDNLYVDIEVKAAAAADAVLSETSARPQLQWALSSFNHDVLRYVRTINPTVELWPLTNAVSDDVIETALELGSPQIAVNDRLVNADIINELERRHLKVWVWTVNDPARASRLAEQGAVGYCTDDPAGILSAIRAS